MRTTIEVFLALSALGALIVCMLYGDPVASGLCGIAFGIWAAQLIVRWK